MLGVGLLLVAFPMAHGVILSALYLPVALMLIGLILRGVAFDFRVKARAAHKPLWNCAFFVGSLLAGAVAGLHAGQLHPRLRSDARGPGLRHCSSACAWCAGYALLGAGWLIMKTEGELQRSARCAGRTAACG